ncbi:MAG: 30S ribosomal protein S6 [Patescibacteria group bacterium]
MKNYELLYIIPSQYTDQEIEGIIKTITELIEQAQATIIKQTNLGKLKLAYPIGEVQHGNYVLTFFETESQNVKDLDRRLQLSDEILRHTLTQVKKGEEEKKFDMVAYVPPLSGEYQRKDREQKTYQSSPESVRPKLAPPTPVAEPRPAMSIEELDKKLDEILDDADMAKGV